MGSQDNHVQKGIDFGYYTKSDPAPKAFFFFTTWGGEFEPFCLAVLLETAIHNVMLVEHKAPDGTRVVNSASSLRYSQVWPQPQSVWNTCCNPKVRGHVRELYVHEHFRNQSLGVLCQHSCCAVIVIQEALSLRTLDTKSLGIV
eukprot:3070672-Amphidinium_carterae.1